MTSSITQTPLDIQPLTPISPPSSLSSSHSSTGSCKSVQFSRFIKISFTYPGDEYDRSALEPAKLTYSEATELMQLRGTFRQEMEDRLEAASMEVPLSPVSPVMGSSSMFPSVQDNSSSSNASKHHGRPHSLLLSTAISSNVSHSTPPCSPILSHHDSCSSSSDDDDYPAVSPALTAQQQQQRHRLKRFGSSCDGMMHRHGQLEQTRCIA
ncbi:hypothetical protein BGW39_001098 [Mortierella sp. 14UC]|nr:hypothetical protein BGW39_001098 [Mortierella sp. 14UC]